MVWMLKREVITLETDVVTEKIHSIRGANCVLRTYCTVPLSLMTLNVWCKLNFFAIAELFQVLTSFC